MASIYVYILTHLPREKDDSRGHAESCWMNHAIMGIRLLQIHYLQPPLSLHNFSTAVLNSKGLDIEKKVDRGMN